jgi:hypothetical protein
MLHARERSVYKIVVIKCEGNRRPDECDDNIKVEFQVIKCEEMV